MILITGGTGLVGAHLIMSFAGASQKIKATYRSEESLAKVKQLFAVCGSAPNVDWVKADVNDLTLLKEAFIDVKTVYHCAALVSFEKKDKEKLFKTNTEGTANIVNCCLDFGVDALCYVSSTAAIGINKEGIGNEEVEWEQEDKVSNYSVSKYFAELEVWRGIEEGLNAAIVNPAVIIGAGDWEKSSSNLFLKVWKGLRFYSLGVNGFVNIEDVVTVMRLLIDKKVYSQRFLLVGEHLTFKALFEHIADALNVKRPTIEVKKWMAETVWRIEAIKSFFFGTSPLVTRESAESALSIVHYQNDKVKKYLDFEFTSIKKGIEKTALVFKASH